MSNSKLENIHYMHAAYWDVKKGEVVLCDAVDISIAVATEKVLN